MPTHLPSPLIFKPSRGHAALRRGRVSEPGRIYFLTMATLGRRRVFTDDAAARCAAACFDDHRLLGTNLMLAWVLMPDHAHCLLQLGAAEQLGQSVSRIKSATARHVNASLGRMGHVWARGFHDHALRNEECLQDIAAYLLANPVRAGLVDRADDYPYWNSVWR